MNYGGGRKKKGCFFFFFFFSTVALLGSRLEGETRRATEEIKTSKPSREEEVKDCMWLDEEENVHGRKRISRLKTLGRSAKRGFSHQLSFRSGGHLPGLFLAGGSSGPCTLFPLTEPRRVWLAGYLRSRRHGRQTGRQLEDRLAGHASQNASDCLSLKTCHWPRDRAFKCIQMVSNIPSHHVHTYPVQKETPITLPRPTGLREKASLNTASNCGQSSQI